MKAFILLNIPITIVLWICGIPLNAQQSCAQDTTHSPASVPQVKTPTARLLGEDDYKAIRQQLDSLRTFLINQVKESFNAEERPASYGTSAGPGVSEEDSRKINSARFAVHLLGEMRCEEAAPILAQALHKPFGYLRHQSKYALVKIGKAAVEPVLKELPAQTWSRGVINILWVCKGILGEQELKRRLTQMKEQATSDDEKKRCDMYIELVSLDLEATTKQSIEELIHTMKKYGPLCPQIPVPWKN
jgi:hypothetical protein